jgi:PAS domain S-box-containing protein
MHVSCTPVRLLILEDSRSDAELEERALRNGGIVIETCVVDTRASFVDALTAFSPDLVIADYNLPEFDGLAAVKLIRERDVELPIILATGGNMGEEAAAGIIKAGANDYIHKDHLQRLPHAVSSALAVAEALRERKETALALRQYAIEVEDLYNHAPCGYHSTDGDLLFVSINDTELRWLGYQRDDVVGKMRVTDVMTPNSAGAFRRAHPRVVSASEVRDLELELIRRDGTVLPVRFSSDLVANADGTLARARTTVYDNSQLKALELRQRKISDDLRNILFSIDIATLFVGADLRLLFFTPSAGSLFGLIVSDIGRPLTDFTPLSADADLLNDCRTVLRTFVSAECEFRSPRGEWCFRRALPYRALNDKVAGIVLTFTDITEWRRLTDELEVAKRDAEIANGEKSRFLAAASHDLRQPLQSLTFLQSMLVKTAVDSRSQELLSRFDVTLSSISGMLDALLDINQIEDGNAHAKVVSFNISEMLCRLREEFTDHAHSMGLALRVIPCSRMISSDPRLLEQMVRNLLSNALKYTKRGRILLGCRRHNEILSIEVWDTGIGIPHGDLQTIFDEYRQLDDVAHERRRGFGLGLSIVQRLGVLLGHKVRVRSRPGKGSVFAIEAMLAPTETAALLHDQRHGLQERIVADVRDDDLVLVIEDDPELCELLELVLKSEGHGAVTARDGVTALGLVARGAIRPDLILADYNLPNGMNGLEVGARLRKALHHETPVIILTADISTGTLRDIGRQNCVHLGKPVKVADLMRILESLLARNPGGGEAACVH